MKDFLDQDVADIADDARRLMADLDRQMPGTLAVTSECRPPVDVVETAAGIEVVMDVPGVAPACLRVALRRGSLILVGAKAPPPTDPRQRIHLAERGYGRFARAVRLAGSFDGGRARAVAAAGQLRVVVPRIEERRGRLVEIPVETS